MLLRARPLRRDYEKVRRAASISYAAMRILAPMARNPRRRGDAGWLTFLQAMKNVAI